MKEEGLSVVNCSPLPQKKDKSRDPLSDSPTLAYSASKPFGDYCMHVRTLRFGPKLTCESKVTILAFRRGGWQGSRGQLYIPPHISK